MKTWFALTVLLPGVCLAAPAPFPTFKVQEIDKTLKVGYGLRIVDLNADGKLDIVVADAARVIWFDQSQDWKLRTIIDNAKAGVKADNVCLDVADIDGDGDLDVALGADWQPNNTKDGGSLQWLQQGKTIDEWTVHAIAAPVPTLHRINFADLDRDGRDELIVAPLKGAGSTAAKNWMDSPVELVAYAAPAKPEAQPWQRRVLDASMHVMHNFAVTKIQGHAWLATSSYEGVSVVAQDAGGVVRRVHLGHHGNQDNPNGARGSSEVKYVKVQGAPLLFATIEPFHGHELVVYGLQFSRVLKPGEDPGRPNPPPRFVVDPTLAGGHALWCADLDGDGVDEVIAGARDRAGDGRAPGVFAYKTGSFAKGLEAEFPEQLAFEKYILDAKEMACEDLACADLNGDGRIDVVAVGRATGNVRIYWNQGIPKP